MFRSCYVGGQTTSGVYSLVSLQVSQVRNTRYNKDKSAVIKQKSYLRIQYNMELHYIPIHSLGVLFILNDPLECIMITAQILNMFWWQTLPSN